MSTVYANGREISAKKDANKSICAMPDVCLSPPSPPAGPIPIPYPNTATASDTDEGSKTVKIGGDEVGLKNKSDYKKSSGDEAATKSLGMGVVSHNIQGPMKHSAWSMDVKIEGENVIRHLDLTIHNHGSPPNGAVTANFAKLNAKVPKPLTCKELEEENDKMRRNDMKSRTDSGYTATTASFTPSGGRASYFMKALTPRKLIKPSKRAGYAKSRGPREKMSCTRTEWGAGGNNNHTEPKLIEQLFPTPGSGTLRMSIFHKPAGANADSEPCTRCRKGICTAVKCGLTIKLCERDGTERKPPCNKNGEWEE
jgi:Domain of unknown function (DUF4150)